MAKQQKRYVSAPITGDRESLSDFSSVVQDNLADIYDLAHTHDIRTTAPEANEGMTGDIVLVELSGAHYLYCKISGDTWKRTAALI